MTFGGSHLKGMEYWFLPNSSYDPQSWEQMLAFSVRAPITFPVMPGFAFLMGVGVQFLYKSRLKRGWAPWQIQRWCMIRAAVIITLDYVYLSGLGMSFLYLTECSTGQATTDCEQSFFSVVWPLKYSAGILFTLGVNLCFVALFVTQLKPGLQAPSGLLLGLGMLLGQQGLVESLDTSTASSIQQETERYGVLFLPRMNVSSFLDDSEMEGVLQPGFLVMDPIFPWLAVTLLGAAYGRWYIDFRRKQASRVVAEGSEGPEVTAVSSSSRLHVFNVSDPKWIYRHAFILSGFLFALFLTIRLSHGWGNTTDIDSWGWYSLFALIKYPPSLAYLAYTGAANFFLFGLFLRYEFMGGLEKPHNRITTCLLTFAQASLCFYITHFMCVTPFSIFFGLFFPESSRHGGLQVLFVVVTTLGLTPVMFWICSRYNSFKSKRPPESWWKFV